MQWLPQAKFSQINIYKGATLSKIKSVTQTCSELKNELDDAEHHDAEYHDQILLGQSLLNKEHT